MKFKQINLTPKALKLAILGKFAVLTLDAENRIFFLRKARKFGTMILLQSSTNPVKVFFESLNRGR